MFLPAGQVVGAGAFVGVGAVSPDVDSPEVLSGFLESAAVGIAAVAGAGVQLGRGSAFFLRCDRSGGLPGAGF